MSVSAALSNALSGLTAAARGAEVVSANIANAQTPGFARRELALSAQTLGGAGAGVQIDAVARIVDGALLADRRTADAAAAGTAVTAEFAARLQSAIGLPGEAGALSALYAGLEASLTDAAARPDSAPRLQAVVDAAADLATRFNAIGDDIQAARLAADGRIAQEVQTLNDTLSRVADLNRQIQRQQGTGRDATGLMDQRQQLVDRIATIVPLREVARDDGQIALYTTQGAALLDGRPARVEFAAAGALSAETTLAAGGLSGLTLNGRPVATQAANGAMAGGSLAALFALRDDIAPDAQAQLDSVARDLVTRLQDPALLPAGPGAGLFTDAGAAFDPADEVGLAGRIALNPAVDPAAGGALWRLRAGIDAATPNAAGDAGYLLALSAALTDRLTPASGALTTGQRSAAGLAGDLAAFAGTAQQAANDDRTYAATRAEALQLAELSGGVDSDRQLQNLLLVEQAFAANAKVIKTVDDMIQTLIGLT